MLIWDPIPAGSISLSLCGCEAAAGRGFHNCLPPLTLRQGQVFRPVPSSERCRPLTVRRPPEADSLLSRLRNLNWLGISKWPLEPARLSATAGTCSGAADASPTCNWPPGRDPTEARQPALPAFHACSGPQTPRPTPVVHCAMQISLRVTILPPSITHRPAL
jgi:hypothetical protein